jgi:PAT family beta-lactamase induction signal transducer AmpG
MAKSFWRSIWNPRMLTCVFVGFASGLPLYFLLQLVPAWLRRHEIDLKTIGIIGLTQLPYAWKFVWSPLLDRYSLKFFGRRRTWMLITQVGLLVAMAALGWVNPTVSMKLVVALAFLVALFSATQDIAIDALRRDILPDEELGLGNSFYVNAYRIAGLVPGSLSLILSDTLSWPMVFLITALFMIPGLVCTLVISEPSLQESAPKSLREAVVEPFREFFQRSGMRSALLVLAFMLLYKFGDNLATALVTPFYIDVGFSNTEIGAVAKLVGFWCMIVGGFLGGLLMVRIGINRALWIFGFIQLLSILGFALLNEVGKNIYMLGVAVGFEYLGVGLGTTGFVAYIASQTNKKFSATQLALFTSFFAIPRNITGVIAGVLVEGANWPSLGIEFNGIGWTHFFFVSAVTAIPGMVLLHWVAPWNEKKSV